MSERIILITDADLKTIIIEAIREVDETKRKEEPEKLLTVNKVARRTGRSHATITKLRNEGVLRSTKDGLILGSSLEEYLYSQ
ncbi:MAG: hypothetical protein KAT48_06840 [Bacteroidales bacterium]|nr:hypothetical protein [Bacteroidales bacterium]